MQQTNAKPATKAAEASYAETAKANYKLQVQLKFQNGEDMVQTKWDHFST
jgi:hypothetical protein